MGEVFTMGPTSLMTQTWAPRDMRRGGTINADGFGAAWWTGDLASSYRNAMPAWTDPAVTEVLGEVRSTAVVAAVRSATVGMPVVRTACAPFVDGRWAFSHNGVVTGWPNSVAPLAESVPTAALLRLEAPTDSATLWAMLKHRLDTRDPATALADLVRETDAAAPASRLNLLLGDGRSIWATSLYHSLSVYADDTTVLVASEPLDDRPGWRPVPDRSLVHATVGSIEISPL